MKDYFRRSKEHTFRRKDKMEANKSHLIGYDLDDNIRVEIIRIETDKFIF